MSNREIFIEKLRQLSKEEMLERYIALLNTEKLTDYVADLEAKLALTEKALEMACKDVHDLTQNQTGIELCYECEHFDLCNKISNVDRLDLECEQVFAIAYKNKAEKEKI